MLIVIVIGYGVRPTCTSMVPSHPCTYYWGRTVAFSNVSWY